MSKKRLANVAELILLTFFLVVFANVDAYAASFNCSDGDLKAIDVEVRGLPDGYEVTDITVRINSRKQEQTEYGDYTVWFTFTATLNKALENQTSDITWDFSVNYDDGTYSGGGGRAFDYIGYGAAGADQITKTSVIYPSKIHNDEDDEDDDDDDGYDSHEKPSWEKNPDEMNNPVLIMSDGGFGPDVRIGKQDQGPLANYAFQMFRIMTRGWKKAFDMNLVTNGITDYSHKRGELYFFIPNQWCKENRKFALVGLKKDGGVSFFSDFDTNPNTVTVNIDIEGYAFELIYLDDDNTKQSVKNIGKDISVNKGKDSLAEARLDAFFNQYAGEKFPKKSDGGTGCAAFARSAFRAMYGRSFSGGYEQKTVGLSDSKAIMDNISVGDVIRMESGTGGVHWFVVKSWDANGITVYQSEGIDHGKENRVLEITYPWSGGQGKNSSIANFFNTENNLSKNAKFIINHAKNYS